MRSFATPVDYTGSDGEETTYCKFASDLDFLKGYWHFIQSGPYQDWTKYKNNGARYISYIAQAGYSADPNYVASVTNLFSEARILLAGSPARSATVERQPAGGSAVTKREWTDLKATHLNTRHGSLLGIILHDTTGTGKHNDTLYLANPGDGRKVSVAFTVEGNGSIWKLNPDLRAYYSNHAGRATSWQSFKNAQVNAVTIGIEIVQKSDLTGC